MIVVPSKQTKALTKIPTKKPQGEQRTDLLEFSIDEGSMLARIRATDGAGAAEIVVPFTLPWITKPRVFYMEPKQLRSLCVGRTWTAIRFDVGDNVLVACASSDGEQADGSQLHILEPDLSTYSWPDVEQVLYGFAPSRDAGAMPYVSFASATLQLHLSVAGDDDIDLLWDHSRGALRWSTDRASGIVNPLLGDAQ